jgi:catechol 2,3-dioxygenase-like lactoylglutathione lyase family enzyme
VEVLSGRILVRPVDPDRTRAFYRDTLGLAVYREFGHGPTAGTVFFLGGGFLEVSGQADADAAASAPISLWLQVRDVEAAHARVRAAGVRVLSAPRLEPWGLVEMWITDPDGIRIVLVEIPADHPLRRDPRPAR